MKAAAARKSKPTNHIMALAIALGCLLSAQATAREPLRPGSVAPDFSAPDSRGQTVNMSSFKGKTIVLEWNNPECPYVRKHYGAGNMQALQKEATSSGVVWLSINSGARGLQGHMHALEAENYIAERRASPSAYLLDPEGKIGRAYGATVTPHMFIIDPEGRIAYMGGIDDKPTSSPSDIKSARNYVREALNAIAAGRPINTASTRPYGCTVKYTDVRS